MDKYNEFDANILSIERFALHPKLLRVNYMPRTISMQIDAEIFPQ
jgi:hypothetical protein